MSPQESATPQFPNEDDDSGTGGGRGIGNTPTAIIFLPNETFGNSPAPGSSENRVWRSSELAATSGAKDLQPFYWKLEESLVRANFSFTLYANNNTKKAFGDESVKIDGNDHLISTPTDDAVTFDLSLFVRTGGPKAEDFRSFAYDTSRNFLSLRVAWQKADKTAGFSFSPVFVVVETSADVQDDELSQTILDNQVWPKAGWEGKDTGSDNLGSGQPSNDDDDNSNEGGAEGDDNGSSNNGSASGGGGGGGGGSLSPGAIAGISVGGAVVLIALAVLLWFFLRRRRSKAKSHGELSQSPNPSNHYIGSKEGNDGDLNSPYSEDGANITQQTPLDPNAPRSLATDSPAPFSQYRDAAGDQSNLARAGTNTSISTHSHSPVESGSRGLPERSDTAMSSNHRVAHLVEEGMTEEDIRRLEEEERQLDVEIERAGRR